MKTKKLPFPAKYVHFNAKRYKQAFREAWMKIAKIGMLNMSRNAEGKTILYETQQQFEQRRRREATFAAEQVCQ